MDKALPKPTKSRAEIDEPRRVMPNRDIEEPNRKKERNETLLPRNELSKMDSDEPIRHMP